MSLMITKIPMMDNDVKLLMHEHSSANLERKTGKIKKVNLGGYTEKNSAT